MQAGAVFHDVCIEKNGAYLGTAVTLADKIIMHLAAQFLLCRYCHSAVYRNTVAQSKPKIRST